MADFEEEYLDVLQNIESAITSIYRSDQALTDYDVDKVLNILVSEYKSQQLNRDFTRSKLSPLSERLYESVKHICEWRLGREVIGEKNKQIMLDESQKISVDEIIACLKRILKSVSRWNKQGGQRGYLQFIDQFIV